METLKIKTIHGYGPLWTYKCIDASLALINNKKIYPTRPEKIEITQYSLPNLRGPNYYIAKLLDKWRCRKFKSTPLPFAPDATKILQDVGSDEACLNLPVSKVQIVTNTVKIKGSIFFFIKAYCLTAKLFLKVIFGGEGYSDILNFTHRGVHIGDLVCSVTIREYPSFFGRLKLSNALFHNCIRAICLVESFNNIDFRHSFVMTPDYTYFPTAFSRTSKNLGAFIIESSWPYAEYKVGDVIINNYSDYILNHKNIKNDISRHFNARLRPGRRYFSYMNLENPKVKGKILDMSSNEVMLSGEQPFVAIVFLHNVSDSGYLCGLDGYNDMVEWSEQTIQILCDNQAVSHILVKPHPNSGIFLSDSIFEEKIISNFKDSSKVIFLHKSTSIHDLRGIPNMMAISHHGSVLEEAAFLKIPTVSYHNAFFRPKELFVNYAWDDRMRYEEFLLNIKSLNELKKYNYGKLKTHVAAYRLLVLTADEVDLAAKFKYYSTQFLNLADGDFKSEIDLLLERKITSESIINFLDIVHDWNFLEEYFEFVYSKRFN